MLLLTLLSLSDMGATGLLTLLQSTRMTVICTSSMDRKKTPEPICTWKQSPMLQTKVPGTGGASTH